MTVSPLSGFGSVQTQGQCACVNTRDLILMKVDDGLELRKAAYECMYTLLATFGRSIDLPPFIGTLVEALGDDYDIAMLAHLIVIRLAAFAGASLLEALEQLVEPLRVTLSTKTKEGAVKQVRVLLANSRQ